MKALSLTQPWASMIALGAKRIETRSWETAYRGPVAIHASKRFPKDCRDLCDGGPFRSVIGNHYGFHPRNGYWVPLPLGAIIAIAHLDCCLSVELVVSRSEFTGREYELGNYDSGRYAFLLSDVRALPRPISCRGALGLWEVPPAIAAQIT